MSPSNSVESFDCLIIGAGISGINTAHYIQEYGPPDMSYAIFERRGRLGGTWDVFQYPGIRSDSDIFTFGFSWNPWPGEEPIVAGDKICAYLSQSATKEGIDKKIRFYHHVTAANWSSRSSEWRVQVKRGEDGDEEVEYRAKFLVMGTGYYDYDEPLKTTIPGIEAFKGPVIQPQFWPKEQTWVNKNVVVIGSGATAITLVPSMAEDARHVTMLQRSPTYIMKVPMKQPLYIKVARAILPLKLTGRYLRLHFMLLSAWIYYYCQSFPTAAKRLLSSQARKQLPPRYEVTPHFSPRYNPWDQRLCFCPEGDFYSAIRSSKASVVTDVIDQVTEDTIQLKSGKTLKPDLIVAATGIKLSFAGNIKFSVDGKSVDPSSKFAYKACMIQDLPNMAFMLGYANASWTLGAEASAVYLTRLWKTMAKKNIKVVTPRAERAEHMKALPPLGLTSTYVKAGAGQWPKASDGIWAPKRNVVKDTFDANWCRVLEGLETR